MSGGKGGGSNGGGKLTVPADMEPFGTLWEFLSVRKWPDGQAREPGTVLVFTDGDMVKVMLNDKDSCEVAFGVVDSSEGLLATLEAMLTSNMTDWRPTRKGGPARR